MSRRKIVIVGAGLAGLAAGHALQKLGYDVEMLEKEEVAGGRMRSETRDGFVIERGAQFISSSYRNMRMLAGDLGLSDLIVPLGDTRNAVLKNGRFVLAEYEGLKAFGKSKDLSLSSKLRLLRLAWPLWSERRRLDFYHPEKAARLDDEAAATYSRRMFGEEVLDYLVEPAFAGTFTILPEKMSKAFLLSTLATVFRGFRLLSFRGGNGILTSTLASGLNVRTGVTAERIVQSSTGITVSLAGAEQVEGDAAIVAVPGDAVRGLCDGLSDEEERFFAGVRYASSIIAFVKADTEARPPFYGAGFPRREGVRLYGMAVENAKAGVVPAGKVLFNCAFSEDLAAPLMDAPDSEVIEALRAELARLPLRGLNTVEGYEIHRWRSLVPQFYPGYHRSIGRFLRRRRGSDRLAFAGDYLIGPYTEAALTSGLRAADQVVARFPLSSADEAAST